ncbi:MAG TPA: Ku protein [Polyangiales bacterium]|jgi:DNA end-binding protein Ku|nr:Ku protein [Polyangiales bacterium]
MAARATSSTTISFGLVSIPVKVYTATSEEGVHFNQLHAKCGGRIKQRLYCPTDDEFVERTDLVKGYEVAKNQYVQFTEEELHALDAERFSTLDLVEFVPENTVDFVYIERSHYLGPDKGGEKAFNLLSRAMRRMERIAVGKQWSRGKVNLVLLRPYKKGLILHHVYYANEVRSYDDVELGPDVRFSDAEDELAGRLIEQLSQPAFAPDRFEDEYAGRVAKAAAEKAEGLQITVAPEQPAAQIIDLFEALKQSLREPVPAKKAAAGGGSAESEEAAESMKGPRKAPARPKKSGGQKKLG